MADKSSREFIRHSPGEMVIGLTTSYEGAPCVGMTFDNKEYILYKVWDSILADPGLRQLNDDLGVEAIAATPFSPEESINTGRLSLANHKNKTGLVGVYVLAEYFDNIQRGIFPRMPSR